MSTTLAQNVEWILAAAFNWIENVPTWKNANIREASIAVWAPKGGLATCDKDTLTQLVLGCCEKRVRMDIKPCPTGNITMIFTQRDQTTGYTTGHPTIEQAITKFRRQQNL